MENRKLPEVILTLENLNRYKDYLTVGRLKEMIKDMPDDGLVLVQRIEDFYYENNKWGVILKEGEDYHWGKSFNEDLSTGKYADTDQYPNFDKNTSPISEEDLELSKEQYHPAWCGVRYADDPKNLYLDLHY